VIKYFRSNHLFPQKLNSSIEYLNRGTINEALEKNADLIDISYSDYLEIRDQYPVSQLDVYNLGAADCLMLFNQKYYLYQLSSSAFLQFVSKLKINLKTNEYAVIVGDELTISQFLPAMTKLGYSKFMFIVQDSIQILPFIEKIKKTFFGISIDVLNFKHVSLIENLSSLLLVDVDHARSAELIESLTYFNFLTAGSVFFDVRSSPSDARSKDLVLEAERAQMFVLDANQYYEARLDLADQILTHKIK
jgi:hypothetical protein